MHKVEVKLEKNPAKPHIKQQIESNYWLKETGQDGSPENENTHKA